MKVTYDRHYGRFHPDTLEHDASLRALLQRWLGPYLPAEKSAAIVDVGCGRGYALGLLRQLGYAEISGIDPDEGQVKFAVGRGLPVSRIDDSASYLRRHSERYDLVLLMDVLEHLDPRYQFELLGAIRTALRAGGRLLCTVPNAAGPIASYFRHVDLTHQTAFTRESLEFALERAGLAVQHIGSAEFFVRPRFLFWLPSRRATQYWLQTLHRVRWRIAYLAELGLDRGWDVPLSPNLLAVARRS